MRKSLDEERHRGEIGCDELCFSELSSVRAFNFFPLNYSTIMSSEWFVQRLRDVITKLALGILSGDVHSFKKTKNVR
jgi:hypothetical protein